MDRNWNEILQELRVPDRYPDLRVPAHHRIPGKVRRADHLSARVYLVLVMAAVLTTALGLAPVNLHRGLFREGAKMTIVQTAHIIMRITLAG